MTEGNEFKVTVVSGKSDKKTVSIKDDRLTIGTDPKSDLRLRGDGIAPHHAVIQRSGTAFIVSRRSTLPMRVNDRETMQSMLEPGSIIAVGTCQLRFELLSSQRSVGSEEAKRGQTGAKNSFSAAKVVSLILYLIVILGASLFFLLDDGAQGSTSQSERLSALNTAHEKSELKQKDEIRDLVREAIFMETRVEETEILKHLSIAFSATLPASDADQDIYPTVQDPLQTFIGQEIRRHSE